jgi:hypothetical protein
VSIAPVAGTIVFQRAGSGQPTVLRGATAVPVDSVVDASRGTLVLASALDGHGARQFAGFRGGKFEIRQSRTAAGMTDIFLRGESF